jgi:hypothetical protein
MVRRTAKAGSVHKVETDYADPFIGPAAVRFLKSNLFYEDGAESETVGDFCRSGLQRTSVQLMLGPHIR